MKKACKYCGKIHEKKYICPKKPIYKFFDKKKSHSKQKRNSSADIFRSSHDWKRMREFIRQRDGYMCVACRNLLQGTIRQYNPSDLSVHHITPLRLDFDIRLAPDNLITLCSVHHEMAEKGQISADTLRELVIKNNVRWFL